MKMKRKKPGRTWIPILGALILGVVLWAYPNRRSEPPAAEAAPSFKVPTSGDPEYADYQEMLRHPQYRSSLENTPGYVMPYDPEWRSVITGRREVGPNDLSFVDGGSSLEDLGETYLESIRTGGYEDLIPLRITRDEFELILWPEFPQSRPFVHIPSGEAWTFQFTKFRDGYHEILHRYQGKDLVLEGVTVPTSTAFTNFTLYENLTFEVREPESGERLELNATVAEREGRFKFLSLE
jgi:hypothetical protein